MNHMFANGPRAKTLAFGQGFNIGFYCLRWFQASGGYGLWHTFLLKSVSGFESSEFIGLAT